MQKLERSVPTITRDATTWWEPTTACVTSRVRLTRNRRLIHALGRINFLTPCLAIILLSACRSDTSVMENQQGTVANNNAAASAIGEVDLVDQVEIFATDIGELGDAAWKELEAYPRQDLIDKLSHIRDSPNQDESVKANVAFVLCNLHQDYKINREIIVSIFNQSLDGADQCEGLLGRLISRGDKELLQVLFAVVPKSDGSLSEGLADTFADQMRTSTDAFLKQLERQPRTIRRTVSDLIDFATSDQDKVDIKTALTSLAKNSPMAILAEEMLSDLSQIKKD